MQLLVFDRTNMTEFQFAIYIFREVNMEFLETGRGTGSRTDEFNVHVIDDETTNATSRNGRTDISDERLGKGNCHGWRLLTISHRTFWNFSWI